MYLNCKINANPDRKIYEDLPTTTVFENPLLEATFQQDSSFDKLDGYVYQKNLVVVEGTELFKLARKLWRQSEDVLSESSLCSCDVQVIKTQITNLFIYCYNVLLQDNENTWQNKLLPLFELFKKSVLSVREMDDDALNKLVSNNISVESEQISHYFHMYLAVNRLILATETMCITNKVRRDLTIQCVMKDLVTLSTRKFQKYTSDSVLEVQLFPCYCIKKFWWHLHWILYNQDRDTRQFWQLFDNAVNGTDEKFSLLLLYNIVVLQGYNASGVYIGRTGIGANENFTFIEKQLHTLINVKHCDSAEILSVLHVLDPLLTTLWIDCAKLEPYQILWEYFNKNLTVENAHVPKSCREFLKTIDSLKSGDSNTIASCYECFISMLYKHLRVHPKQWPKLRGRIYSRLPAQKVKDFNDKALYRIGLLFLMLARVPIAESVEKLLSLLEDLPKEKRNNEIIWITYVIMIITCVNENVDIAKVAAPLLKLVQNASENRDDFHLIKQYISGLDVIMNLNDNFTLNQNILIDVWIIKYASSCSYLDLCNLANILVCTLERVQSSGNWCSFKTAYSTNVLSALKQNALVSSVPPQIGRLAALICLGMPEMQTSLVQYFCGDQINVKVTQQFLCTLLKDNPMIQSIPRGQEIIVLPAWVKCCLLCEEFNSEELTKIVFDLDIIKCIVHIGRDDVQDPLPVFIKALRKEMLIEGKTHRLKELCEISFGHLDTWLHSYLTQTTSDSHLLKIYNGIALLFYHCAPLLYHKTKSSCLLNRLITVLLLPTEMLMGKPPRNNILNAVQSTWHLFVQGIYSLDYKSDAYIERTLKDLTVRYLPYFVVSDSPLAKVFEDDNFAEFILEKITNAFLMRIARSSEENTFKAVKTLQYVLEKATNDTNKIKLILKKVLVGVLEVIMFNSQKSAAVDFIKYVTSSEWYFHVQSEVRQTMLSVSEKHLSFNAQNFFQLAGMLIKLVPNEVRACLPEMKKQITHVERMRGVGFDVTLRQGLERIENALVL